MKTISVRLLQAGIVVLGIVAAVLMLWEPQIEGVNAHATLFEIYFQDPFLAYAYVASIPVFVGLSQAFKLLGHAGRGEILSQGAAKSLRTIRHCALAVVGFVAGGEVFILLHASDDRAGGVFVGGLIALGSIIVAATAAVLEGHLQRRRVHGVE